MNPISAIASALLAGLAGAAAAAEYGTVVSSTPVTQQLSVPQQECWDEPVAVQQRSGVGGLVGAIVGGVVGNQFGHGAGRAAATGLGMVAGAALGDRAEAENTPTTTSTVPRCRTAWQQENRVVGYDVVYDYGGRRYSARLPHDPGVGARIALDVTVAPAGTSAPSAPPPVYTPRSAPPVYAPPPVYTPPPSYYAPPAYYAPGAYYYGAPAVVVSPRLVIGVGGHWHRGHWR